MICTGGLLNLYHILYYAMQPDRRLPRKGAFVKTRTNIYITLISIIGMGLGLACCVDFFLPIIRGDVHPSAHMIIIPLLVCSLCRSFPLVVRNNERLDLCVISVLAVYLTQGPEAAIAIYTLSSLFTFEPNPKTQKLRHIMAIGPRKLFFNDATVILPIILPHLIIRAVSGWVPGDISLPAVLIPAAMFSLLTFLFNGVFQLSMFCINGDLPLHETVHILLGLTPNVIATMPLGLLMSYGYASETSMWFVFLMLFPLLLARYAWKLYLDSENARSHLIQAFVNSIEAKDKYTQGHSQRVSDYSVQIAQQMKLSRRQIQLIRQGAVLHDIGKIGISDLILNKPGKLTPEEMATIQQHPLIGVKVLEEVGLEPEVLEMVRSHHERYDGGGYPEGCSSKDLSLAARILCVADAYDAMTSDRPYRKGMDYDTVRGILMQCRGTQFDPEIIDAFIASMEKK